MGNSVTKTTFEYWVTYRTIYAFDLDFFHTEIVKFHKLIKNKTDAHDLEDFLIAGKEHVPLLKLVSWQLLEEEK